MIGRPAVATSSVLAFLVCRGRAVGTTFEVQRLCGLLFSFSFVLSGNPGMDDRAGFGSTRQPGCRLWFWRSGNQGKFTVLVCRA